MRKNYIVKIILLILVVLSAAGMVIVSQTSGYVGYDGTYVCSETGEELTIIQKGNAVAIYKEGSDMERPYGDMYFYDEYANMGTAVFSSTISETQKGYCVIGDGIFIYMQSVLNRYARPYVYEATVKETGFKKIADTVFPPVLAASGILLLCSCIRHSQGKWFVISAIIYAALAVVMFNAGGDSKVSGRYRSRPVEDHFGDYGCIDMWVIDSDDNVAVVIGSDQWKEYSLVNFLKDDNNNIESIVNNNDISKVLYKSEILLNSDLAISNKGISMLVSADNGTEEIISFKKPASPSDYTRWAALLPAVLLPVGIPTIIRKKKTRMKSSAKTSEPAALSLHETVYRITSVDYVCSEMEYMRSYLENNQTGAKVAVRRNGLVFNGAETLRSQDGTYTDGGLRKYVILNDGDKTKLVIRDGDCERIIYEIERDNSET